MKKSLGQRLFSPIALLQIIILCVLMLFALGLTTPLGPIAIERISNAFFTPLEIKGFHGSFLTGLKVGSLQWEDPDTTVELEHIVIDKPRYNFEKNQLHSDRVSAQRLVIRLPPSDDTPSEKITSLPDFALPLNIKTDALALQSFEVIQENEVIFQIKDIVLTPLNIESGKLNAGAATAQLIIAGSPLNLNVQQFVMNMNQPHDMQGNGRADFKQPQLGEAKATFELEGTLTAYRFKLKGNIDSEQVSPQTIQLAGHGDYDQVIFSQIKTHSLEGNSDSNATVEWTPELMWQVDTKLEQVKLAKQLPDWPAKFDATLNYHGSYQQNSLDGALDLASLDGMLNGKKIKANAKIKHKDQQFTIDTLQATLGQNEMKASGQATPPFDLSWDINAKNLRQLLPDESIDLSGKIVAKGTLKGTLEQPILNGNIHAQTIRFQEYTLDSADLIATSSQGVYRLKGDLEQLDLAQQKISKANINASGIIEDHQLELSFIHTDAKVQLNAKGGWKAPQWQGSVQRLVLDTQQVSKWQLQQPVNINASKDQLTISKFCLVNRSAHSCSTVHWSATTGIDAKGSLKRTPLALLNPFLSDDIVLKGNANGRYKIKQQQHKLVGDVSLELPAGEVAYGKGSNKQSLDYRSVSIKALIDGQEIKATANILLKNNGKLTTDANILLAKSGDQHQIDAKGKLTRLPLLMARPWLPQDIQLNGQANGHFNLKQQQGEAVGEVSLQLPASSVVMGESQQKQQINYKSLTLNALINGRKITATTKLVLKNRGELTADADILLATSGADHQIDAKGNFKRIPLAMATPWLPKDIQLKGSTKGAFTLKQRQGKSVGDVSLQLPASSVVMGEGKQQQHIDYQSLTLNAVINGQKITATTQLVLQNKGELSADADILLATSGTDHHIDAKGKFKHIPLVMATPWLPKGTQLKGSAKGAFKLKQRQGKAVGEVSLQLPESSVIMGEGKQQQRIDYQSLTLKALINGQKITATTQLVLQNRGELSANANILLATHGSDHHIDAKGTLKGIPLAMATPWLPKDIQLKGSTNGAFKVTQRQGKAVGDVSLRLPASSVIIGEGKQRQRIDYQSLTLKALINGQKITATTQLVLQNRGELSAAATILLAKSDNNHRITAKGKLTRIPLLMAKPWLPHDIQLKGSASGRFDLKQQNGNAVGDVSLSLPASAVIVGAGREKQAIDYQSLQLTARLNGQKITAKTKLLLKNRGELTADANILLAKNGTNHQINVNGKLNRIPLAMAKPWMPKEMQLNGNINGQFNLKPKNGKLAGDARLQLPANTLLVGTGAQKQRINYKLATLNAILNGDKISAKTQLILTNNAKLSADANIELADKQSRLKINAKGNLTRIPLAMLQPWMPKEIQLKGDANGKFNLKQVNGKSIGEASLALPASSVLIGEGNNKQQIDYQTLTLNAVINDNKITAKTRLLLQNNGELKANATVILDKKGNPQQTDANGTLNNIPLAMAKPWLPKTLDLKGNVQGDFKLQQSRGNTAGNVVIQLPNSRLSLTDEEGAVTHFEYRNAIIKAAIKDKTVLTSAKMQLNGRGDFAADAKIILGDTSKTHRIQGNAAFDIPNIDWMQSFAPQTTQLGGRVFSKVTFNGLLSAPKITGQVALQDATFKLPKVGTHFKQINLSIKANDAHRAIIKGSLASGQGKVTLAGFVSLKDLKNLNAEVNIKGSNLQFINTHEALAVMNPNITIKVTPKVVDILGKVHIPSAKITLNAIPESSVDESEDVIVIGEKKADGSFSALKIHPNLIVSLGKDVNFEGFGLVTKLGGAIQVTHDRQSILTQGSIKVNEGHYQAYGQNLTINDGRLIFNGPPTYVGMDIKAQREIDDITAGIHLTGTLQQPVTKLFSTPTLSESNILSYLLTGHSLNEITGSQTALLIQAVRSLNVTGGEGLERNIGNSLGLDDLSIIPKEDLKKSELRLGKKLGSKLYVRYIVGIFDSMQKIALEYKVNKYLNLEAQAGTEAQSIDFIYQVETN